MSPDGRWIAYQSNESGRFEIYVRPFPDGGPAHQVSTEGGIIVKWPRADTLLYRAVNGMMMTVAVETQQGLRTAPPKALFDASRFENLYGVAPDLKRLLMMPRFDLEQTPTAIALVQNFLTEIRQRIK